MKPEDNVQRKLWSLFWSKEAQTHQWTISTLQSAITLLVQKTINASEKYES